ncbi:hypothetical protein CHS0354_028003 [Potamilus streckersoni]|uniref:Uncharacterized protein n=1 Tax=Potamilus streckersoni TaxID=2493646 RepID=A0AAE0T561_9BIVA|nr:hypothetical protein CHS0354_028003 [Potamilus streckersoni]
MKASENLYLLREKYCMNPVPLVIVLSYELFTVHTLDTANLQVKLEWEDIMVADLITRNKIIGHNRKKFVPPEHQQEIMFFEQIKLSFLSSCSIEYLTCYENKPVAHAHWAKATIMKEKKVQPPIVDLSSKQKIIEER